jgi:hypothetical protein
MNEMWVEVFFASSSSTASGWKLRISNPANEHHMFEEGWCHNLARHHCNYSFVYSKRYYDAFVWLHLPLS